MSELPINSVLPDLLGALRAGTGGVLIAPPGAGKTTAVAPALLGEAWCSGTVILLSPRRVAARAAAERMAEQLGEKAGETIGYVTRLDTRRSARTRVLVMTEAIFVSTILSDPELSGVSAVLFDEAHERHLDSDLGLALAIECRDVLRDDLRLVVMSATIDGTRFAALLGEDTPVVESEGKAWPLDLRWLGSAPDQRIEDAMTSAILTAWREQEGDVLAFLPGVREIERVAERLADKLPQALVLPLHGQCEPAAQRAAIRRDREGRRRIVLATAIAETSLTLDGVSVVVDSGLSRRAEFDKAAGVTRLVTHRASQASAAQRAGRAARQGPGVAYRLWEEAAHAGRPAFDPPEIVTSDLAPLTLSLAQWGSGNPAAMAWLDPPPVPTLEAARKGLQALGALDESGRITEFGGKVASLPMEPAQAAMVLRGSELGASETAARVALLLQERGLGGRSDDLAQRLSRWNGDRSPRAEASRKLAGGWAKRARSLVSRARGDEEIPVGALLALGRPDMVARRRDPSGESWLSAGGRGYVLDPASPLAAREWMVIGDAQGQAKGARILSGASLEASEVEQWLGESIARRSILRWNAEEGRVEARLERRLGSITLASGPDPSPDPAAISAFLLERVREKGLALVPFGKSSLSLLRRARFAGIESLSEEALLADLAEWLGPLLGRRLDALDKGALHGVLKGRLTWDDQQRLEKLAPPEFRSPAGTTHAIDYEDEGGPSVEVRVQALFGLDRHPTFGQPAQPLLLKLTSPAGRPIQATRDLPGFWRGSWRDVQRDMKGRYPRHRWPDEPWTEDPSLKTRNAFEASKGK
ncbi:ATP-dependent helicase HrpB [Novosphingobium mangrovi (ex Huang et al. 2023)]|uniref:RNA helicase n=1 Tax=Novosphingobium mangrovi (ex Huang et al. 2023) TaxID=2976432 RepID=A0ABT2I6F3_9SPHN|nr:ATP-dependent helicase HrpB [Novosphingobium mangrovi (ex Huang et al. 2023)]MCT2400389.1 ATP-dependent helicase HrpB [Novosphingobium mangrovi (ex Huang et al. 2023)]